MSQTEVFEKPEILAPAGDAECLHAAVAAGADAVYLGLRRFNARGRAENFRSPTLPEHVRYAHSWNAKVYVVMNTLVFEDEMEIAMRMAAEVRDAGADGVIIQDLGLFTEIGRRLPDLPRLASTQMTVHNVSQAHTLADLGVRRIILAREMGVREIATVTESMRLRGVHTEVFIHGALCFSYSGQCLMSNMSGARSANRGVCAQNCRMEYSLAAPDGKALAQGALLSMKDLASFRLIPDLIRAGVGSLKIEGRLKRPEYVAVVTRMYRDAVDAAVAGRPFDSDAAVEKCSLVFNRGFTDAWLRESADLDMRAIRHKAGKGAEAFGTVVFAERVRGRLRIRTRRPMHPGLGFTYSHGGYRGGFLVTRVLARRDDVQEIDVRFGAGRVPPIPKDQPVFLNSDAELYRAAREIYHGHDAQPEPLHVRVSGRPGEPLEIEVRTDRGESARLTSSIPLEKAREHALDAAMLREKLGRLGDSSFELAGVDSSGLRGAAFLPPSELNRMRRDLLAAIEETRRRSATLRAPIEAAAPRAERERTVTTRLAVAVATADAARRALASGADEIYLDLDEHVQALDAATRLQPLAQWTAEIDPARVWLKTPLVTHPALVRRYLATLPAIGIVASNLGVLREARERGRRVVADHYLNAYNSRTIDALSELGAGRVTVSLEIHAEEAVSLGRVTDVSLELLVQGRVPVMTARAPFGLANGEEAALDGDHGFSYVVKEFANGHSVIFEGRELVGLPIVPVVRGQIDVVRLDVAHHSPDAIETIVRVYRAAVDSGAFTAADGEVLQRLAGDRIFLGHLKRGVRELDFVDKTFAAADGSQGL
ncbi:MAG: U32 family peptidase [Planctomycetes bacterium]|nr:U32 family peptidase [Planctomycetota bacterium]MBI3846198.1 U32 family peptidase [Planctomycetota bacterium]